MKWLHFFPLSSFLLIFFESGTFDLPVSLLFPSSRGLPCSDCACVTEGKGVNLSPAPEVLDPHCNLDFNLPSFGDCFLSIDLSLSLSSFLQNTNYVSIKRGNFFCNKNNSSHFTYSLLFVFYQLKKLSLR